MPEREHGDCRLTRTPNADPAPVLGNLDPADRQRELLPPARVAQLKDKITAVKQQMGKVRAIEAQLSRAPDQQVSLTDPESGSQI